MLFRKKNFKGPLCCGKRGNRGQAETVSIRYRFAPRLLLLHHQCSFFFPAVHRVVHLVRCQKKRGGILEACRLDTLFPLPMQPASVPVRRRQSHQRSGLCDHRVCCGLSHHIPAHPLPLRQNLPTGGKSAVMAGLRYSPGVLSWMVFLVHLLDADHSH